MAFNLTNIASGAMGGLKENLGDLGRTVKEGATSLGGNLLQQSIRSTLNLNKAVNGVDIGNLPGQEWDSIPDYTVSFVFNDPQTGAMTSLDAYMPDTISIGFSAEYSSPLESLGEKLSGADSAIGATARLFGYKVSSNLFSMLLWSGASQVDLNLELKFVARTDSYNDIVVPIRQLASLITPVMESFSQTNGALQLGMVKAPGPVLEIAEGTTIGGEIDNSIASIVGGADAIGTSAVDNFSNLTNGGSAGDATASFAGASVNAVGGTINQILRSVRVKNNISVMLGRFCYLKSVVIKDVSPSYNIKVDADGNWIEATVSVQLSTFVSPTNLDIPHMVGMNAGVRPDAQTTANQGTEVTETTPMTDVVDENGVVPMSSPATTESVDQSPEPDNLNLQPQTASKQLYNSVSTDPSMIGKDSGLGSSLTSFFERGGNANSLPPQPGMVTAELGVISDWNPDDL